MLLRGAGVNRVCYRAVYLSQPLWGVYPIPSSARRCYVRIQTSRQPEVVYTPQDMATCCRWLGRMKQKVELILKKSMEALMSQQDGQGCWSFPAHLGSH